MNGVLAAFIGVPATMLVAGGLGIIGLAIYTRVIGTRRGRRPIHWGHVSLGDGDVRRRGAAPLGRGHHLRRDELTAC